MDSDVLRAAPGLYDRIAGASTAPPARARIVRVLAGSLHRNQKGRFLAVD
jgi:hypothetical protein